jgi:cytosine/adenosine deaminase-related metal-dependent hydrolase
VTAGWVVPVVAPVLRGGWIDVDAARGEILAIGHADRRIGREPDLVLDLSEAVVLPGLVNAHTHLELSHMAGAVPPAPGFVSWVRAMLASRFGTPATPTAVHDAVVGAIAAMESGGTAGVGDIGNTDAALRPLAASSLSGIHFREALGFRAADAERIGRETMLAAQRSHQELCAAGHTRLVPSVAPHAPYSTSPALIRSLARGYAAALPVASVHLAESPEEVEFLARGSGPFRDLLADLGAWDDAWRPPGLSPVAYLQQLGALHEGLLVVHGTQFTPAELETVVAAGATLVLCARSNRWVGAGVPPVAEAFRSGVRLAIGTDSLASVEDLNLFAELAALRAIATDVPASALLRAATHGGAQALRLGALGYLGPGATSRAVVRVPPAGVTDVEEWLVAGAADTADLRWLDVMVSHAAS